MILPAKNIGLALSFVTILSLFAGFNPVQAQWNSRSQLEDLTRVLPENLVPDTGKKSTELPESSWEDRGDYFYLEGKRVALGRQKFESALVYRSESSRRNGLRKFRNQKGAKLFKKVAGGKNPVELYRASKKDLHRLSPQKRRQKFKELTDEIKRDGSLLRSEPVFINPETGKRIIMGDAVLVKLKKGFSSSALSGYGRVTRANEFDEDIFRIQLSGAGSSRVLRTANSLHLNNISEWAEPEFHGEMEKFYSPNDTWYSRQQHLHNTGQNGGTSNADIDAETAWDTQLGDTNIVIAIIDDGVQLDHPDLNIEPGGRNYSVNPYTNDASPSDPDDNHGTSCAGVAAAIGNNSLGVTGVAPHSKILPIKIAGGSNFATNTNFGNAVTYSATIADVISISWGWTTSNYIENKIEDAATSAKSGQGVPVFIASGNSGGEYSPVRFDFGDLGLPDGSYTIGISYIKDGSVSSSQDVTAIDNFLIRDTDGYTIIYSEDFSGGGLPSGWTTSGDADWFNTNTYFHKGLGDNNSLRSGNISDNEYSELRGPLRAYSASQKVEFMMKLHTESGWDEVWLRVWDDSGNDSGYWGGWSGIISASSIISFPARADSAIAVGASTDKDYRSGYSQFNTDPSEKTVDFLAPSNGGWNGITTVDRTGSDGYDTARDYTFDFGGTSSATPTAAGVAALLLAQNPDLTRNQLLSVMRSTADKVGDLTYTDGKNYEYGYGRVNAFSALSGLPPYITGDPAGATRDEGDTVTFTVAARGFSKTYQWQHDPLSNGTWTGVSGGTSNPLSLVNLAPGDAGDYRVIVSNSHGADTSGTASLTVNQVLPVITSQPQGDNISEGDTSVFSVTASGSGLSYQWQHYNVGWSNISGATSSTYAINEAVLADSGGYRVVVTNSVGSVTSDSVFLSIGLQPPEITSQPVSDTVSEDDAAGFSVTATGTGLSYQWQYYSGGWSDLGGSTASSHNISNTALTDSGGYRVIVTNTAGSAISDSVHLTVNMNPPSITSQPVSDTVTENDPANFSVTATGTGLSYQWQQFTGSWGDLSGATSGSYAIANTVLSDSGAYRVVVTNAEGSVTSDSVHLTVNMAIPVITSQPVNATVAENDPANFSVTATGTAISYQWQHYSGGWSDMGGETSSALALAGASMSDSGGYRVKVTNDGGTVTSDSVHLTVNMNPPAITSQPVSDTVSENDPANFSATAAGTGLSYQWQHFSGSWNDLVSETSTTLSIGSAALSDSGGYRLQVSNDGGTVTSDSVHLTVNINAPVITAQPGSQTVTEFDPANFSVTATGSDISYQWQHYDGGWGDVSGATAAALAFSSSALSDSGGYRVLVSNGGGSVTSDSVYLTVNMAVPVIVSQPANQSVTENSTTGFAVTASGTGITYQWQHYDAGWSDISGSTFDTLYFASAAVADSGGYRVVVTNAAGSVTSDSAHLVVNANVPVITAQPVSDTVAENDPASFTVTATGTGLSYQWQHYNGGWGDVGGAVSNTYAIGGAVLSDSGGYRVVVSNFAGDVTSDSVHLTVNMNAPAITAQPTGDNITEDDPANFSVTATGTDISYQWQQYTGSWGDISGATSSSYAIASAVLSDSGGYRVTVTNAAGSVTSDSVHLIVALDLPVITVQPTGDNITEDDPADFSVTATGTEISYQWQHYDGGWSDIGGATTNSHSIANAALSDSGGYRVVVSNDAGSVTSDSVHLVVAMDAPVITAQPSGDNITEDDPADFSVTATGTSINYQWQHYDGGWGDISGATSDSYSITNAVLSDSGGYRVILSNDGGSVTSDSVHLAVAIDLPVITVQPAGDNITEQDAANFSVTATGTGISYQWQHYSGGWSDIAGAASSSHAIASAVLSDSGGYRVLVSNGAGSVTSDSVHLSVAMDAPVIIAQPTGDNITEGDGANFSVTATGTDISYQWQHYSSGWVNLSGSTGSTHSITNAVLSDSGGYRVIVTNNAGSVTSDSLHLNVGMDAPVITVQPGSQVITEGDVANFSVTATGTSISYQWQRYSSSWGDIIGATASAYSITNAVLADSGGYRVVVTNEGGAVTSDSAHLTVNMDPPVITGQPQDLAVTENGQADFAVTAAGTDISYQWQRYSVSWGDIGGATLASYSIANASLADSGGYRVVVSNAAGSVTSDSAHLTVVMDAPQITVQPQSDTVFVGDPANLTVTATGTDLSYQWQYFDGNWSDLAGATSSTYAIASAAIGNTGGYQVIVSNEGGTVTSDSVHLTVIVAPPVITSQPVSQTATEFDTSSFSVTATGTKVTYQWQHYAGGWNDIALAVNNTYSNFLTALADSGGYRVVVSSTGGSITSDSVYLTVNMSAPIITGHPQNLSLAEGETAIFEVTALGTGVTYQWQVFEGSWSDIPGATADNYTLPNVQLTDSAGFRVILTNSIGSVTSDSGYLTVNIAAPVITQQPVGQAVSEDDPVDFSVTATGSDISYQWQHYSGGWNDISGATNGTLAIANASLADSGGYRVNVSNEGGSVTSDSVQLSVNVDAPAITLQPVSQTVAENDPVNFSVSATGTGISYQWQHYSSGWSDLPGATTDTFAITSASLGNTGGYRVTVANTGGSVTSDSVYLTVNINPPVITAEPVSQTVNVGSPAGFGVAATGTSVSYQWQHYSGGWSDLPGAVSATHNIASAAEVNAGGYRVLVSNAGGIVTSDSVHLTVNVDGPVIIVQPEHQAVSEGDTVAFSITATGLNLTYQWQFYNGGWSDIAGATASGLLILNTSAPDTGGYRVIVTNSGGFIPSDSVHLSIIPDPPAITTQPTDQTVTVDDPASFTVTASGINITYQWQIFSGGWTDLPGENSGTLAFASAALANTGGYRVQVSNTGGNLTSDSVQLTVLPPVPGAPATISPADLAVDIGLDPQLIWSTVSADYYQLELSQAVDFSGSLTHDSISDTTLDLTALNTATGYYWRVRGWNAGGMGAWSVSSFFTTIPSVPAQVSLVAPADSSENLAWDLDFSWNLLGGASGYEFQLSGLVDFSDSLNVQTGLTDTSASSAGLDPKGVFYWRVRGSNSGGKGPWSETRIFTTRPQLPAVPLLLGPGDNSHENHLDVMFKWQVSQDAGYYLLQVSSDSNFADTLLQQDSIFATSRIIDLPELNNLYYWRVQAINVTGASAYSEIWLLNMGGITSIQSRGKGIPQSLSLVNHRDRNSPMSFRLALPEATDVQLILINPVDGKQYQILDQYMAPGWYVIEYPRDLDHFGVYAYYIRTKNRSKSGKLLVLKNGY